MVQQTDQGLVGACSRQRPSSGFGRGKSTRSRLMDPHLPFGAVRSNKANSPRYPVGPPLPLTAAAQAPYKVSAAADRYAQWASQRPGDIIKAYKAKAPCPQRQADLITPTSNTRPGRPQPAGPSDLENGAKRGKEGRSDRKKEKGGGGRKCAVN